MTATNNHCAYKINGHIIGNPVANMFWKAQLTQATNNHNNIHHASILPYNLAVRDIILAQIQIISSSQTNKDIPISNIFTKTLRG
jgi:hypothetical protein